VTLPPLLLLLLLPLLLLLVAEGRGRRTVPPGGAAGVRGGVGGGVGGGGRGGVGEGVGEAAAIERVLEGTRAPSGVAVFDYDMLREKLQGLGKEALVELWIAEHQRLADHGLTQEAKEAYDMVTQVLCTTVHTY